MVQIFKFIQIVAFQYHKRGDQFVHDSHEVNIKPNNFNTFSFRFFSFFFFFKPMMLQICASAIRHQNPNHVHPFLESSDATEPKENKFNSRNQVDDDHILNLIPLSIFYFIYLFYPDANATRPPGRIVLRCQITSPLVSLKSQVV